MPRLAVFLFALVPLLMACGRPAGSSCEIRGSGFTAHDPCAQQCLSRQRVDCPDGRSILPGTCSGKPDCEPGSCPSGQACYHFDDPFEERSYCVMADTCGPLEPRALASWESESELRARRTREAWAERRARRTDPKAVTQPIAPAPAPVEP